MSVDTMSHQADIHVEDSVHNAPSDGTYVIVALALAGMTGVEVGLSYLTRFKPFPELALLFVMAIKFITVCLYFMHLKFDEKMCRRVFFGGLSVALVIYITFLSVMHFWAPHYR